MAVQVPDAGRPVDVMPGHWVLARLGKRVLRPGGAGMTRWLLDAAQLGGKDVVELAPGLGRTAAEILERGPASYRGVEKDDAAAAAVREVIGAAGECIIGDASATGLPAAGADVVIGEAMLTMHSARGKKAIVGEATRIVRPGGLYVIHELAVLDDLADTDRADEGPQRDLARSIKVNAQPLTPAQWHRLLEEAGFEVVEQHMLPMALLDPRRVLADEGPLGAARFVRNVIRDGDSRARVLSMRKVFRRHRKVLRGIALVARRAA